MLSMLKNYSGNITVNGKDVKSAHLQPGEHFTIVLTPKSKKGVNKAEINEKPAEEVEYVITVKQYMTKPSEPGFDFMAKWNNDVPMPLRTMVGTIEKETPGMYKMNLHAELLEKQTQNCLCCGKPITNPVSMYFGMGPKCGKHNYVNPFESDEELEEAVQKYKEEVLSKITWSGWVIKSSIISKEVKNESI